MTSDKPPIQWRESWREACKLGSKTPKQREGTTWFPQSSTYPKSEQCKSGLEHRTKKHYRISQKPFNPIQKLLNVTSLQLETWIVSQKNPQRKMRKPVAGGTDLGWPVTRQRLTSKGGWAGRSECPTGASSPDRLPTCKTRRKQQVKQVSNRLAKHEKSSAVLFAYSSVFMGTKHLFDYKRENDSLIGNMFFISLNKRHNNSQLTVEFSFIQCFITMRYALGRLFWYPWKI